MRIAVFSTQDYDREYLEMANRDFSHTLSFFSTRLDQETVSLAKGFDAICVFVNDRLDGKIIDALHAMHIDTIALRCAGFNNVDITHAAERGMSVVRVPAYSPHAVAEFALGMMLTLNRKFHKSYLRTREGNFSLSGLRGFDMQGKTIGVIGLGRIGLVIARILVGFDSRVLGYDISDDIPVPEGVKRVSLDTIFQQSDIITLHCPLTPDTFHLINDESIASMKPGVMLINTSRGAVTDAQALIRGLKSGKIGALGLDVYEQEGDLFFKDLSNTVIQDDVFERLLTFPNVIVTGHQGFFTHEALVNIARTTLQNVQDVERGNPCDNCLTADLITD